MNTKVDAFAVSKKSSNIIAVTPQILMGNTSMDLILLMLVVLIGPRREKTCLRRFANNKGADQPAHPRSLISAFVIHCLESTISKLTTCEISTF